MNETTQLESSTTQQAIVETVQILSLAQQQQVLSFAQSLSNIMPITPSLRQLATLPVAEQHRILANYVPMMVEDFRNDPELTEFSVLDGEDWAE
jgi:hypothetical protein